MDGHANSAGEFITLEAALEASPAGQLLSGESAFRHEIAPEIRGPLENERKCFKKLTCVQYYLRQQKKRTLHDIAN